MADFILMDGDQANFLPNFGPAVVVVQPGTLMGSGPATINGKKVCVVGDEGKVSVPGCSYTTPVYPIPGVGTLMIDSLAANQQAQKTRTGRKSMMLKGGNFVAKFQVVSPAQQPNAAGPIPDSTPQYLGQGMFITANTKFRGQ